MRFLGSIFAAFVGIVIASALWPMPAGEVFPAGRAGGVSFMGLRGPAPKSAEVRIFEGERAHRPLPNVGPKYAPGVPPRPKGMPAKARAAWDAYIAQLGPLGILRPVDGFALSRLCEDVAQLEVLRAGKRALVRQIKNKAKAAKRELQGSATIELTMSQDGRRLDATINTLANRIKRDEMQFGLTPISSARLTDYIPANAMLPAAAGGPPDPMDPVEAALCG